MAWSARGSVAFSPAVSLLIVPSGKESSGSWNRMFALIQCNSLCPIVISVVKSFAHLQQAVDTNAD